MNKANYTLSMFSEKHVESRINSLNSKDSISGITIPVPVTLDATTSWCQKIMNDPSRKDLVIYHEGDLVGFSGVVSINNVSGNAELYIFMVPGVYGNGHGTELLKLTLAYAKYELNLRKMTLYVTDDNAGAIRFYEINGFKKEGTLRAHLWHRGRYVDRHIYSLFLQDFLETASYLYGRIG